MMHPDELEEMNYNRDDAEYRAVMIADNHDDMGMDTEYLELSQEELDAARWEVARAAARAEAEADAAAGDPF